MNPSDSKPFAASPLRSGSALSHLFSAWTQHDRLLRLHTPLDAPHGSETLLAESLHGVEGMEIEASVPDQFEPAVCGYRLHVTALSLNAHLQPDDLIGQPILLELLTAHSRTVLRPFHGHLTVFECLESNGGLARYRLTMEPWVAFLRYRYDSRLFQDMTVVEILDAVFRQYQVQGRLVPDWRFALAESAVYRKRSLTTQFQESDLAFVERLLLDEGLFMWFEHVGSAGSPDLGRHRLVIADHNGAFTPNRQPAFAFTQSGAVFRQDGISSWQAKRHWCANAVELASWDYRTVSMRPVAVSGMPVEGIDGLLLAHKDIPGTYAYADADQGMTRALRHMQAIDARAKLFCGKGSVRTAAPGTTFVLHGHTEHDREVDDTGRRFAILRVTHEACNNFPAELRRAAQTLLSSPSFPAERNRTDTDRVPLYCNRIDAVRAAVPWRPAVADAQGRLRRPKPSSPGQQTAIVVGSGAPAHTDRDHRIQIQFHWQRGVRSHSRLDHPFPEGHAGAPATSAAGTWVRVAATLAPIAGANWGSVALPRVGQEVVVDFLDGDIDRPIVVAALYNGRGQLDGQGNAVAASVGAATANAPAWFAGEQGPHAHPMVFSGLRSQQLDASQRGDGGLNQLLFDDTPGECRIALQQHATAHAGTAELNLGHLRHQADNQRLDTVGYGFELATQHSVALRAGAGMLLSAHSRLETSSTQMDSAEAQAALQAGHALAHHLAEAGQRHRAGFDGDGPAETQPAIDQLRQALDALTGTRTGKDGTLVTAYASPELHLSAPAGIAAVTPADGLLCTGASMSVTARDSVNIAAQGRMDQLVKSGIRLFTAGADPDARHPNRETGIALHAACGPVRMQSQTDATAVTARDTLTIASTHGVVEAGSPERILLTSGGASIRMEGGNIEIQGPGIMAFNASMVEFAGPRSTAFPGIHLSQPEPEASADQPLYSQRFDVSHLAANHPLGFSSASQPYRIFDRQGRLITSGVTNPEGMTDRIVTNEETDLVMLMGDGDWEVEEYMLMDEEEESQSDQDEPTLPSAGHDVRDSHV